LSGSAFAYGDEGEDTILAAGIAYGGPGNDRILEGNVLYGGRGDDYLEGGFGASRIVFDVEDSGQDIVTDTRGLTVDELAEWYYPAIGMPEWRSVLLDPATEDRFSIEEGIARGLLPALPQIAANDFTALEPLYAAGVIDLDTVEFAQSLTPDDVDLSLGEVMVTSPVSGALETYGTLDVSWTSGSVARIVIPHAEDLLGTGIEQVRFADGTVLSLAQMLERESAGPAPLPTITGTEDADFLIDTADSEQILGLDGDDFLKSLQGNDVLDGGPGNDFHEGGAGDHTYVFGHGYHVDTVLDDGGVDSVRFAEGIASEDVSVTRDPYGTLYLVLPATGDRILLVDWFNDPARLIESARFSDGTVWDAAELQSRVTTLAPTELGDVLTQREGDDAVDGLGGNDEIYGLGGDDVLAGGAGDDFLEGGAGHDIVRGGDGADGLADWQGNNFLDGSAGDDNLLADGGPNFADGGANFVVGGAGNDRIDSFASGNVIAFNAGDGQDTVYALYDLTLSLGAGIEPSALSLSQNGTDLVLVIGANDSIRLTREFELDPQAWPSITLQMFGSVHLYDFNAVIADFQAAIATDASLTALPLDGMLQAHETSVSETDAIGGALAYQYGTVGSLDGVSDEVIRQVLADANFGTAPQSIAIAGSNQAPVVAVPVADQSAQEDSAFSFAIPAETFSDADAGDALAFSAALADGSPLPGWLSFDAAARSFSGTPTNEDVGAFDVTVTATDTGGLAASDAFQLTVANTNDVPVLAQPLADQSANQNAPFAFPVPSGTFADVDVGNELTLTATLSEGGGLPAWLAFESAAGTFSGTPSELDVGGIDIRVTATDGSGAGVSGAFTLSVSDASVVSETHVGTRRDDVMVTGFANDWIDAGGGDDRVRAGAGRDVILGGRGNDRLAGGAGNDLYIHDRHGGHDVIEETGGLDTLLLGEGITPVGVRLGRHRDNLVVDLKGADGSVTVKDWFASDAATVETIQFADGTAWGVDEISAGVQPKRGERRRDDSDDHAHHHGGRDEDHHGKSDGRKHDDGDGSRPEHKPDRIAYLLEAVLGRKPRYDFEALEPDLGRPQCRGEDLDAREIARRWEVIRRYANGAASERDEDARGGAVHRFDEGALAVGLDFGKGSFDTGWSDLTRGAANLRTLKGLEEGLQLLRG
jgi:Ca2+-binding RTX toxin-like protein